jgi:DNA-binding Lrp family transcriptional regulator
VVKIVVVVFRVIVEVAANRVKTQRTQMTQKTIMFSDPVVGKNFFGRSHILALLAKRVSGLKDGYRQNIAIIGSELLGKSSILRHFLSTLNNSEIIPVYIEVNVEPFNYFAHKFIRVLLYHFLIKNNLFVDQDLASLLKVSQQFIPKTVKATQMIEEHLKKGEFDRAYELLLELSAIIREESAKFCIVVLDEFHLLANFPLKNPFSNLANKIMVQKDTMYIIASSKPTFAKKILSQELSLLFGNFEIIELKPFEFKSSARFLKQKLEGIRILPVLEKFLVAFTNGHPFYLNVITAKLKDLVRERNFSEISPSLIAEAIDFLMFNSQGILNQYFTNRLKDLQDCATMLVSMANNNILKDLAKCNGLSRKDFSHRLNRLTEEGIIFRCGTFVEFNDHMLGFWLKSVYQRKHLSLATDISLESKDFQAEIKKKIDEFVFDSQRSYIERMEELFKLFSNEVVEIGQRRHRLPLFSKVYHLTEEGDRSYFIAVQDDNKCWIAAISEEELNEEKVTLFIQIAKKNGSKNKRKVLIALEGMDINARLLAKQEKIWTWELDNVNLLLKFYRKSPIVR